MCFFLPTAKVLIYNTENIVSVISALLNFGSECSFIRENVQEL